jgi:hypothetical protein
VSQASCGLAAEGAKADPSAIVELTDPTRVMSLGLAEEIVNQDERGRIALLSFQGKLFEGSGVPRDSAKWNKIDSFPV